jgi:hypothetical protein
MDWIKKNLGLVISGAVALALLGFAGYFLYSKYGLSQQQSTRLEEQENKLNGLINQKPNPGNKKVDNIAAAKEQTERLTEFAKRAQSLFINVPYPTNLDSGSFKLLLDNTVDELQREARASGTKLPDNYAFTFSVQKPMVSVKSSTIKPLSRTLMEIKTIVGILFDAKILGLDRIRRISVPDEDAGTAMLAMGGGPSDYWTRKPTTNALAVVVPYEFSFRCFSGELQAVLEGLASSPHNFLVKNLVVDTGETNTVDMFDAGAGTGDGETQMPRMSPQMMMMMRYGMRPGMRYMQPPMGEADPTQAPVDTSKIVSEKPFRVTAWVDVVRMLGPDDAPAAGAARPRRAGGPPNGGAPGAPADPGAASANPTAGTN